MMYLPARASVFVLILALAAPRLSFGEVKYIGLSAALEANARALMPLASADCNAARWRVDRLFRDSEKRLSNALEALGYYDIDVKKSIDWSQPGCWKAEFRVVVGDPVRLRDVSVRVNGAAMDDHDLLIKVSDRRLVTGEILNHGHYETFKKTLIASAQARGYFDADFERNSVTVDRSTKSADVDIVLNSGPRYRFGETIFTEDILRPELLQGYSDIRSGDPYDARAISSLYQALNGSGYFGSVLIRAEPLTDGTNTVPVNVSLTPGMRRVYAAGLGFATDFGLQGRLGYTNRRRNDKGHQFESRLFGSAVNSELTASYRWPRRNPRSDWFSVFGGFQHTDTDTSVSDKATLGVRWSKNISRFWLETRYLNITNEDFRVADQKDTSRLIIPGINWESTRGSEISRIRRGHRMSLDIRGSSDSLGSDTSFLQLKASTKWIIPIGESTRLLTRVDLGATAQDEITELPASVRFFAGGDNSVRGYGYETLGPVDIDGNVIGGSHLATASIELDRLVKEKWSVALFADSGSAFDDLKPKFSTGVGLGLRWYSPVGPIRLDVAHPLNDPDRSVRIHITLGPDL
jgi:translocation and assembly module TamA